jgi:hypothetical protein
MCDYFKCSNNFLARVIQQEPTALSSQNFGNNLIDVGFEVFTAVTMKNAILWDVEPCGFNINSRFGGTCRFHLQGR